MKNLQFANGVELSDDESFILVSETGKYRVHKYESNIFSLYQDYVYIFFENYLTHLIC